MRVTETSEAFSVDLYVTDAINFRFFLIRTEYDRANYYSLNILIFITFIYLYPYMIRYYHIRA